MRKRLCSLAMSHIRRCSSGVRTTPVGLPGLVHTMARVCSLIWASIFARSAYRYPSSGEVGMGWMLAPVVYTMVL